MTSFFLYPGESELARTIFTGPDWDSHWAGVVENIESAVRAAALVQLDPAAALPRMHGDAAILIEDLGQLERLIVDSHGWSVIVFQPSCLACLDALRMAKRSVVARRALSAGHTIASEDLTVVAGGGGLDETVAERLVGTRLVYDVAAGGPITFGLVEGNDTAAAVR